MNRFMKNLVSSLVTIMMIFTASYAYNLLAYDTLSSVTLVEAKAKKKSKKKSSKKKTKRKTSKKKKSSKKSTKKKTYKYVKTRKRVKVRYKSKGKWKTKYVWKTVTRKVSVVSASVPSVDVGSLLTSSTTAKNTDQIVLVYGPYKTSGSTKYYHVGLWNRNGSTFSEVIHSDDGRCGSNGLSWNRRSGDKSTPVGSYRLTEAFGFGVNPGTDMLYHQINANSYWSADTLDCGVNANRYYEGVNPSLQGEHLADYYQYKYAMNIGFNYDNVAPGKGYAIFLHCNGKSNTAGCVSVPESTMYQFMTHVHNGAYIMIVPSVNDIHNF